MEHLYNKIANDLITDIRNNTLFPGNKLPSIRSMSQKYNCSKSTVGGLMEHLYNKIANDLITDIRNNTLFPGNKLPSIRSMSQKYNCSKSTVEKAYSLLIKDHYIYCKPQSGYYLIDNLLTEKTDDNGNIFDFSTGNPNMSSFPLLDLQHCLDRSIDTHEN